MLEAFAARRPDARATSFGGLRGAADAEQALALLDARTLAFGPPAVVRSRRRAGAEPERPRSPSTPGWPASAARWTTRPGRADASRWWSWRSWCNRTRGRSWPRCWARPAELHLERLGGRLFLDREARAVLVGLAPDAREAQALAEQLRENFRALSDRRSVRALGLAPVLRRATATARGARVVLELTITEDERVVVSDKLAVVAALLARPPEQQSAAPEPPRRRSEDC